MSTKSLNLTEKIEFLKDTSLFSSFSDEMLSQIAEVAEEVNYPANAFLFHEDEPGDFIYLIISGEVNLSRKGIYLKEKGFRCRGDILGEMSLLDSKPRSASAMAATDLRTLRISLDHFERLLGQNPQFCRELFKVLSLRLREDLDLYIEAIKQEAARSQELKLASEVQRSLFPGEEIQLPYIQTAGHCEPAYTIGGDYYDYIMVSPERVGIVIGDVMGHGFHSALFVAIVKSCLQTQIQQANSVSKVMKSVSQAVTQSKTGIYITMSYVLIDFPSKTLSYANAGHPHPYHYCRRSGQLEELVSTCMPLGLISGMQMPRSFSRRRQWEKGDILLMYSDGITEAENLKAELFGEERLKRLFLEHVDGSAEEIKATILSEFTKHCQGNPQRDDVTLIVIKL